MLKMPKGNNIGFIEYVLGIYDGKIALSIKAETLKMLETWMLRQFMWGLKITF